MHFIICVVVVPVVDEKLKAINYVMFFQLPVDKAWTWFAELVDVLDQVMDFKVATGRVLDQYAFLIVIHWTLLVIKQFIFQEFKALSILFLKSHYLRFAQIEGESWHFVMVQILAQYFWIVIEIIDTLLHLLLGRMIFIFEPKVWDLCLVAWWLASPEYQSKQPEVNRVVRLIDITLLHVLDHIATMPGRQRWHTALSNF